MSGTPPADVRPQGRPLDTSLTDQVLDATRHSLVASVVAA